MPLIRTREGICQTKIEIKEAVANQAKVARVESQVAASQEEIKRAAARIPAAAEHKVAVVAQVAGAADNSELLTARGGFDQLALPTLKLIFLKWERHDERFYVA